MLEVKDLRKTYKTKGGVETHALDGVTITFPETGMIFLLGKSGSGKSTLLNVIGGLDKVDSGEIIIKGRNSKDFSAADFDSYRNTYIGFIFQEYNILSEFNVESNIALALELQGKRHDRYAVDEILEKVDLVGYSKRKPNTLSGGQKQRVAIARALIKEPPIIMADEPTGALDSKTGKQVFDTLKKLSKEKLIIVVSHDRDFAEIYGDRIIELADGKVISDVTKHYEASKKATDNIEIINENTFAIKNPDKLTEEDTKNLLGLLKAKKGEVLLTSGTNDLKAVRTAIHIRDDNSSESFKETTDVETKEYNPKETKFIRSHLPIKHAFKMGASSLKIKPFRLIFTSFLTTVSLVMFGLMSALMMFNANYAVSSAHKDTDFEAETIYKASRVNYYYSQYDAATNEFSKNDAMERNYNTRFGEQELQELNRTTNLTFAGAFKINNTNFVSSINSNVYRQQITRAVEITPDILNKNNFQILAGSLPNDDADNEIAITNYFYDYLVKSSHEDYSMYEPVNSYSDVINKTFKLYVEGNSVDAKITGIINVGSIPQKYLDLDDESKYTNPQEKYEVQNQYQYYLKCSFHNVMFSSRAFNDKYFVDKYQTPQKDFHPLSLPGAGLYNPNDYISFNLDEIEPSEDYMNNSYGMFTKEYLALNNIQYKVYDANLEEISPSDLSINQVYVTPQNVYNLLNDYFTRVSTLLNYENNYGLDYSSFFNEHSVNKEAMFSSIDELRNLAGYSMNDITSVVNFKKAHQSEFALFDALLDEYYQTYYRFIYADRITNALLSRLSSLGLDQTEISNKQNRVFNQGHYDELDELEALITSNDVIEEVLINDYITNHSINQKIFNEEFNYSYYSSNRVEAKTINTIKQGLTQYGFDYSGYNSSYNPKLHLDPINVLYKNYQSNTGVLQNVGFVDLGSNNNMSVIVSKEFIKNTFFSTKGYMTIETTNYVEPEDARYTALISKSDYSERDVSIFLRETPTYRYLMNDNAIYQQVILTVGMVSVLKTVFLWTGISFGVFASLMLLNFISTSIANKTKEIGILRAVGARGSDLFKIFFSESGIITSICVVIATIVSFILSIVLNNNISQELTIGIFNFGPISIAFLIGGAVIIAVLGTLIPVIIAAKKPPVDSIRAL